MIGVLASDGDLLESVTPNLMAVMFASPIQQEIEPVSVSRSRYTIEGSGQETFADLHTRDLVDFTAIDLTNRFDLTLLTLESGQDAPTADSALSHWIQQVDAFCQEAGYENWDGEGALPVQPGARERAIALVGLLPRGTPLPQCSIDPDGDISLGWHRADNYVFSVSVSGIGRLSYAGLFGESDSYGTEWLAGIVPPEITAHLDQLLSAHIEDGQSD